MFGLIHRKVNYWINKNIISGANKSTKNVLMHPYRFKLNALSYLNTDDEFRMASKKSKAKTILDHEGLDSFMEASVTYEPSCEGHYTVWLLQNVSLMFSVVPAVHEAVLDRQLEVERQLLNLIFALDHQNYAKRCRY